MSSAEGCACLRCLVLGRVGGGDVGAHHQAWAAREGEEVPEDGRGRKKEGSYVAFSFRGRRME